jgi:hypothetical protein
LAVISASALGTSSLDKNVSRLAALRRLVAIHQVVGVGCEAWDLRSFLPSALVEIATFAAETSIVV